MRWYCECWEYCPEDGRFDTVAMAVVSIKIDANGKDVTDDYDDWDYQVDITSVYDDERVTCGGCGEYATKIK